MMAAMSCLAAATRASSVRPTTRGTMSTASTPRITTTTMTSTSVKPGNLRTVITLLGKPLIIHLCVLRTSRAKMTHGQRAHPPFGGYYSGRGAGGEHNELGTYIHFE